MLPLLRSEIFRATRQMMPRVLLLVLAALIPLLYLALWSASSSFTEEQGLGELLEGLRMESVPGFGLSLVASISSALLVIFVANSAGAEFNWKTIRSVLPRSDGRQAFLLSKLAIAAVFLAILVVAGYFAALIASGVVTLLGDLPANVGAGFVADSAAATAKLMIALLPYLALAYALAFVFRSPAIAIGIGLAIVFLEGPILTLVSVGPLERLSEFGINANVQAILQSNSGPRTSTFGVVQNLPGLWQAVAAICAYTAALLSLAWWQFIRSDVTAA